VQGIKGPFDLILDIGCFHNLASNARPVYLQHVARLLDPAGTVLLYVHFRPPEHDRGHGIVEADLDHLASRLRLVSRQDGTDRGGGRPSAWLTYTLAAQP
jgi:hypothetical protein